MMNEQATKMSGGKNFGSLRIAFSALCGLACFASIFFWVRSYRVNEVRAVTVAGTKFSVESLLGRISFGTASNAISFTQPVTDPLRKRITQNRQEWLGFRYRKAPPAGPNDYSTKMQMPHWFLVAMFSSLAVLPWVFRPRWRFSLRTLLIGFAIISIVSGLILLAIR
jgi:hypothetical protein